MSEAAAPPRSTPPGAAPPTATLVAADGSAEATVGLAAGAPGFVPDPDGGGGGRVVARVGDPPREVVVRAPAALVRERRLDAPCPTCGCRHLYAQRDLNRTLGVSFVGLAAVGGLAWSAFQGTIWPLFGCLVVASAIDWTIHALLPTVVVCYRCLTVYRGVAPGEGVGEYDQAIADGYAYSENVLGSGYEHAAPRAAGRPRGDGAGGGAQ